MIYSEGSMDWQRCQFACKKWIENEESDIRFGQCCNFNLKSLSCTMHIGTEIAWTLEDVSQHFVTGIARALELKSRSVYKSSE